MDANYRFQRHFYDLTRRGFLLGRDDLLKALPLPPGAAVLEVGCGTGRNLVRLARSRSDLQLWGFDASNQMLETASAALRRAGCHRHVRLRHGLAEELDAAAWFGRPEGFDAVFFSYALSMIPLWHQALDRALAATAAGGALGVVDFGDAGRCPRLIRRALLAWLGHFHTQPRASLSERLRKLARDHGAALSLHQTAGGYAVIGVLFRAPCVRSSVDESMTESAKPTAESALM